MKGALAKHDAILRSAVESEHGHVLKTTGDGVCAVFGTALEAVKAAISAQHSLQAQPTELEIKVRMGIHTGEAELREQDYFGPALNRAARIMSIGHGGQILLSGVTTSLVREQLPQNTQVTELGEHLLKGLSIPEQIWQLAAPGLKAEFPALQSLSILPNNLPSQLTSFVGREKEKLEIKAMLEFGAPGHADRFRWHRQNAPDHRGRRGAISLLRKRRLADRAGAAGRPVPDHSRAGENVWLAGTALQLAG